MGESASFERHQKLQASLVRFERRVQKGVDRIITPQIDFVSQKTMQGYDAIVHSLLKGDAKKSALRIRPTMVRVAKGMGVSLIVAEGIALTIGAKKGVDWLTKKYRQRNRFAGAQSSAGDVSLASITATEDEPLTALETRVRRRVARVEEVRMSPEKAAHQVLLDEIQALNETGAASDRLKRLLFMTARGHGTTLEGSGDFERSAVAVLEHLATPNGKEAVARAKESIPKRDNPWRVQDDLEQLIFHVIQGGGDRATIDTMSLNWWTFAYRAIGIREIVGLPPELKIAGLDYRSDVQRIPYLEFVMDVVKLIQPGANNWVFHGSSK